MASRPQIDRRAIFFWLSALISLLLVIITPQELRWVGVVLGIWLTLLGVASWLDAVSRRRRRT